MRRHTIDCTSLEPQGTVALTDEGRSAVASILERVLATACPTCKAAPGQGCDPETESEELLSDVHRARLTRSRK
jgi:hypothetical protein